MQLIESERQPLTARLLRTLLVITHKSLFPCIGSSAQLRPHKQPAPGLIYYLRLLIDLFRQFDRQFSFIKEGVAFRADRATGPASFFKEEGKSERFVFLLLLLHTLTVDFINRP